MPQFSGALNALASRARRWAGRPKPGERLDPAAFLRHAADLAARAPPPPSGLRLSLLVDEAADPGLAAQVRRLAERSGVAEAVGYAGDASGKAATDAVGRARAPFVASCEAMGRLAPFAIERIAAALAARPEAEALYADEALADAAGRPVEIRLKPAFDPVLWEALDYLGPFVVYRRDRLAALGGFEGADVARRFAAAATPGAIWRLPYPAWIRRDEAAPPRAVAAPAPTTWPRVGVVVPSRDAPGLIGALLAGLFERTDYPDFDVTVIDNGSTDPETLALYARLANPRLRIDIRPEPFNFSRSVNRGAASSDAPLLLLINNDVEVLEPGWLKEMVACLGYPGAGIVGAKLLYPDRTLQHAGVIAGLGGYAGHWHIGRPEDEPGPLGRLRARQSLSVVTGACMLVRRACFAAVGGFDEAAFPVAYNDVDFCLRAGAAGWRTVYTPLARLIHRESVSRGSDETHENRARFARDKAALRARHRTDVLEDRAYNPWAARFDSHPWPIARADLPEARN